VGFLLLGRDQTDLVTGQNVAKESKGQAGVVSRAQTSERRAQTSLRAAQTSERRAQTSLRAAQTSERRAQTSLRTAQTSERRAQTSTRSAKTEVCTTRTCRRRKTPAVHGDRFPHYLSRRPTDLVANYFRFLRRRGAGHRRPRPASALLIYLSRGRPDFVAGSTVDF
jgi:hypothetical protein